ILVNICYGTEEPYMREIHEINHYFQEEAGQNAVLKCGVSYDEEMGDEMTITIIATGFAENEIGYVPVEEEPVGIEINLEEVVVDEIVAEIKEEAPILRKPNYQLEFDRRQNILEPNNKLENLNPNDLDVPA